MPSPRRRRIEGAVCAECSWKAYVSRMDRVLDLSIQDHPWRILAQLRDLIEAAEHVSPEHVQAIESVLESWESRA